MAGQGRTRTSTEGKTPKQIRDIETKREARQVASEQRDRERAVGSSDAFRGMVTEAHSDDHPSGGRVRVDIHQRGLHKGSLGAASKARFMSAKEVPDYLHQAGATQATVSYKTHPAEDAQGNLTDVQHYHFSRHSGNASVFGAPKFSRSVSEGGALWPNPVSGGVNTTQALTRAEERHQAAQDAYENLDLSETAPILTARRNKALRDAANPKPKPRPKTETRAQGVYTPPGDAPVPGADWVGPEHISAIASWKQQEAGAEHARNQHAYDRGLMDEREAKELGVGPNASPERPETTSAPVTVATGKVLRRESAKARRQIGATKTRKGTEGVASHPALAGEAVRASAQYEKVATEAEKARDALYRTQQQFSETSQAVKLGGIRKVAGAVSTGRQATLRIERDPNRQGRRMFGPVSEMQATPLHHLVAVSKSLSNRRHEGLIGMLKQEGHFGAVDSADPEEAARQAVSRLNEHPVVKGLLDEHEGRAAAGSTLRRMAKQAGVEVGPNDGPLSVHKAATAALKTWYKTGAKATTGEAPKVGTVPAPGYIGKLPVTPTRRKKGGGTEEIGPSELETRAAADTEKNVEKGVSTSYEDKLDEVTRTEAARKIKGIQENEGNVGLAVRKAREAHLMNLAGPPMFHHDVNPAAPRPVTPGSGGSFIAPSQGKRAAGTPLGPDEDRSPHKNLTLTSASLSDVKLSEAEKGPTKAAVAADADFYGTPNTTPKVAETDVSAPPGSTLGRSSRERRGGRK